MPASTETFCLNCFQAMTRPLLMAVASQICQLYVAFASNNNDHLPCMQIEQVANAKQSSLPGLMSYTPQHWPE